MQELRPGGRVSPQNRIERIKGGRVGGRSDKHARGPGPSFRTPRGTPQDNPGTEGYWTSPEMNQKHAKAFPGTERPAALREDNDTLQGSGLGNSTDISKQPGSGRITEKTSEEESSASSAGSSKPT